MTEEQDKLGLSVDATSLSFDNMVAAIAVVQENMGIAGATANEAMGTIEGSANMTKAAWDNLITAIGRGEGIGEAIDALTTSIFGKDQETGLLNQIIPRVQTVMEGIGEFIVTAAPVIGDKIPPLIEKILPSLLSAAGTLIQTLGDGLLKALPTIIPIATQVLMELVHAFIGALPEIINVGIQVIGELISGISEALPELIPAAIDAILTIVDGLINNIDLLIDCAVKLVTGLATGLVKAIPVLVEKAPIIIEKLVLGIIAAVPKLILAAGQIMVNFAQALNNIAPKLQQVGQNLVTGLKNGFIEAWNRFVAKVKDMANNLISSVKNVFSTHSPSRVFEQIGDWCVQGFDIGFESFGDGAVKDVQNAMDEISAVGSPTINPEIATSADAFRYQSVGGNTSDLYGLLSTYLPLLERQTSVNVSLEGDAQGLFRQVRSQTNQFIKSTGASPFLSPA
jgi:phage-related protein